MPNPIPSLAVTAFTVTSALGQGLEAHRVALGAGRSGLKPNDFSSEPLACWIGRVEGIEATALPEPLAAWDCRNNRLAWLGLNQDDFTGAVHAARERYGSDRIALILGTSTASIGATEEAYRRLDAQGRIPADLRRREIHVPHSLTGFVAAVLELNGPTLTVSTACSSSAKAFAHAERMIRLGLVDAAVVGGVDTLCDSTLFGFNALELISPEPCKPFDRARRGISIGEAAGFALLERSEAASDAPRLLGYGESSDAHHMSSPHPQGLGAELAMRDALARAGLEPTQVDYINLHGTASMKNDEVEAQLVTRSFPSTTRASSTKALTGHTLGAAGIVEAAIALLAMADGAVPGNAGCDEPDVHCGPQWALRNERQRIDVALSNSFGFGGNNICLAFARAERAP
ncbi:beta-ketoacyl-[acyl-carrier-protein] synthase family protein [Dyella sp. GSA-30]|uniref:beta-ketoacyl-[acyl-carrier-protein] synthase family protein n=1 Tax=Dyella sp. GSA-30 TaxID=2994496 RepID=UPI0024931615|nr:beta-ketoacyl-[acyl-carrier-protein] synthase family protein [Dyella sp. GSA-30]BDU18877.1 beta-ketoacyl-[acyl-carrier-protein] synthase II [Dyella sp. GSA-30]